MTIVRIALANLPYPPTRNASVRLTQDAIAQAGREGASIICFPEVYVPGYRLGAASELPPDEAFLNGAWADIAHSAHEANVAVVLGTERLVDGSPRITTLVIDQNGETLGFQDKVQLDPT